jgi:PAS domain S-box-containing protein
LKDPPTPETSPKSFPLANKLVLCFALLCTILAAVAGVSFFSLRSIGQLNGPKRSITTEATALPRRMSQNLSAQQAEVFHHLGASDFAERKRTENVFARLQQMSGNDLLRYHDFVDNSHEQDLYREVVAAQKRYLEATGKVFDLSRAQRTAEATAFALKVQVPLSAQYQAAVDAVLRIEEEEERENAAATSRTIDGSQDLAESLIGLAILVTVGTGVAGVQVIRRLREDKRSLRTEMSERESAQVALRESEARYRLLVEHSPDAVFVICETKIVFVNPAALKLLGATTPGQLIGKSIYEILPAEEHAEVKRRTAGLIAGNPAPATERRFLRLDGSPVEVESTAISLHFAGQPAFQVTARDNSERRIAAAKLEAQEKQFRLLFEDNPSPMWVFDIHTLGFLAVNQAAIVSYGYSREEFLRLTLRNIRPVEDIPALVEAISQEDASSTYGGEWRHLKKDGTVITAAVYSSPTVFDHKAARVTVALNRTEQVQAERKLRESEANLALAQKVAGVGSWEYQFTPQGEIDRLIWSQEAYRLFGLPPDFQITTETFFQALHLDDRAFFARHFQSFMKDNAPFKTDFRIFRPDGTERIVHAVAEKILDERTGKLFKVVGTILDLTERRAVEEKLREADNKYRAIFDHALEGIFQNTPEGRVLSANPALARMLGFDSPEQLIAERNDIEGQGYTDPAQRQEFQRALEEKGFVNNFEFQMKRRDGSTIWVSENSCVVRDGAGKALYYEGTMQDITERKNASTRLLESEQRLAIAREAAHMGIWDWNVVTNDLVWDERMYELYGIRAQDFSGAYNAWQKGLHPDDRGQAEEEIMAAVKGAHGFHTEFRVLWPDGQIRNIEAHAEVVRGPDGTTTRMIGANWDITERKQIESELQRQKSELRVLFDLMPAMIWFKDATNGILRVNKRVADAVGKTIEEIEGHPSLEIYPEDAARFYQDDLKVIQSGLPQLGIVETIDGADGNHLWVQTDKVPVLDGRGTVIGIVVMAQDITQRREAEETLRLLNSAVLQSNEAILITDADLDLPGPRIVFVNPAFTAMTGYTAAEVLGETPRILQGPRTDRAVLARLSQTLKKGEVFKGEAINYRKDGTAFDLEWQIAPIRDTNDKVTHFVALQRDITSRRQTEQAQARFAAIMAATTDFVGVADETGRVLYMNRAGRKMVGFTDDQDITTTTIADHVAPSEFPRLMEECLPVAVREGVWSGEMTFVDREGREIPLSQVIVTHRTPSGEIDFIATTAQDLTERKKADAALEEANRQLLDASRQAGMAEVATSVLHNVGNVLNSVNVSCSVISDKVRCSRITGVAKTAEALQAHAGDLGAFFTTDPMGRKLPDFLGKLALRLSEEQSEIIGELQLLSQNIEHIKDIVAVQQGYARNVGGVRETLPIEGLVEDALRMSAGGLIRHRIEVVREYGEAPPFPLEKHKVVQILVNLVRNAKHALVDGGCVDKRLVVRVARRNGNVAVSVSDNGIGIAPENKVRIFSHGFTTKKDGHGFGLHSGVLSAQEMGGSLLVQSDGPGKGATFTLELPVDGHSKN